MIYTKKIALGIFIFSVLVLVILVPFTFFQSRTTGKIIEGVETVEEGIKKTTGEITCSDSDGKNYNIKGVVDYCDNSGCSIKEDSCSGKNLIEEYCENNERRYEEHKCEFECDSGVCVALATKYKYTGSGGGGVGVGGGVSGGEINVVEESGQTYDLGELSSERHLELIKNEHIKFSIANKEYTLTLTDSSETQVTLSASDGQTFIFIVGSDGSVDINSDGIFEIYIKIESINIITNKIKLILRPT